MPWQLVKILTEIYAVAYQCLLQSLRQCLWSQNSMCAWIKNVSSLWVDDESHKCKRGVIVIEKQVRVWTATQNRNHTPSDVEQNYTQCKFIFFLHK